MSTRHRSPQKYMRGNKRLEGSTFAAVWHRLARCTRSVKRCFSAKQPCTSLCGKKKSKNVAMYVEKSLVSS